MRHIVITMTGCSTSWMNAVRLMESYTAKSGEVYNEYRAFCIRVGEFIRSTADFYTALDGEEFTRKRTNKGVIVKGLRLKSEFSE